MRRVLFVDDERNVLDGLRRVLRLYRAEWDMEFVEGGRDALVLLATKAFDVIVTDMRMPGMDGAELLKKVRELHPETVRIMLSGQSDQEAVQRSIGRTHQYLSKPCDPESLHTVIRRSCELRDRLGNESLKRLVSQTVTLPSLPEIYTRVIDELCKPDPCMKTVTDLISRDVGMSARLLHLVNSSFFGIRQRVESPAYAASLLGLNILCPLILSAGIFCQFDARAIRSFSINEFSDHSLAVSNAARLIAMRAGADKEVIDDAQMAGMVHDVGQLLLASQVIAEYDQVLHRIHEEGRSACEIERELLGSDHADVGAHLLGLWGLPEPIVEAVALHHEPSKCVIDRFTPLTAVHVANVVINKTSFAGPLAEGLDVDLAYLKRIGLADAFPHWQDMVLEAHSERVEA
jgi:HD-like signal output (HDOD) protein